MLLLNIFTTLFYLSVFAYPYDDRYTRLKTHLDTKIIKLDAFTIYPYDKVVIGQTNLTFNTISLYEKSAIMSFYNDTSKIQFNLNMHCEANTKPYRIVDINIFDEKSWDGLTLMMDSACKTDLVEIKRFYNYRNAIIIIIVFQFIVGMYCR